MLFTAYVMKRTDTVANVTVTPGPGETPEALAARARDELVADAGREVGFRTPGAVSDEVMAGVSTLFHDMVLDQARSGEPRHLTAWTRGGRLHHAEGMTATLIGEDDIVCTLEAVHG